MKTTTKKVAAAKTKKIAKKKAAVLKTAAEGFEKMQEEPYDIGLLETLLKRFGANDELVAKVREAPELAGLAALGGAAAAGSAEAQD